MNLILLAPEQALSDQQYKLSDRQIEHISKVLKKDHGDKLRVGVLNGLIGDAVLDKSDWLVTMEALENEPPKPLPMELVLALPRPNMLKRTLMNITAMGVKKIHLLHSAKVEKSYWQSPVLKENSIYDCLVEGLEQARDTVLPEVHQYTRFRPFVEDVLPDLLVERMGLVAHPYQAEPCPVDLEQACVLAIGPEGGWNDFEMQKWSDAGMQCVHLGDRILKVETAVPVLLSRLYPAK
ncbi:16S rRNA (uracil(1498)-N(3))-methyltransferase [Marinomonas ostreistagni]|uniref:Ribosomal RNA small subunit methyltransferase E n=1 Tax=Marinomonas ostreistagni TaxID=359209 RepID=A0ABS0ZF47_9GAMM|nr:16S rRNA (uracil(1498)-N(3))-methyltransferase [Marinomonas ostreistagni]MBJ7552302.1 16S rRNA (uracil(1498)-N(3))-methyltransferase [Marinomonas ostreistagni]